MSVDSPNACQTVSRVANGEPHISAETRSAAKQINAIVLANIARKSEQAIAPQVMALALLRSWIRAL